MNQEYVYKARAIVNAKQKLLPQRTHWASVAGVLSYWLIKKDLKIRELTEEIKRIKK